MPAPPLSNNFEGGTNGAAIAATDTGSGTQWDSVVKSNSGAAIYTNAQFAHGAMCGKFSSGATAGEAYGRWASIGAVTGNIYFRTNIYLTARPASLNFYPFAFFTGVAAGVGRIFMSPGDAAFHVRDANDAVITALGGASTIPLNTWVRLEWRINCSTGDFEWRYYNAVDGTTITETKTATAQALGANVGEAWFGVAFGVGNEANQDIYLDDVAVSTTGWLGPATPVTTQTVYPTATVSAGSWTSSGPDLWSTIDETSADDTDYDMSSSSPVTADEMKVRLGPLVDPNVSTGHTVSYRYKKDNTGGDRIDLTVTLYAANGTTVIHAESIANIDAVTTGSFTLTTTETDAIPSADYATGLVLGFKAIKV